MAPQRILAVDLGARHLGWAVNAQPKPVYGDILMPGIANPGELYAATRNELERLILRHKPKVLRFVPSFISATRTSTQVGQVLTVQQGVLELVAYDNEIDLDRRNERTVRKQVLGTCDFGRIDAKTGKIIPDSGREEAKAMVMAWCGTQGFRPRIHDVGDALVLLHYNPAEKARRTIPKGARPLRGIVPLF